MEVREFADGCDIAQPLLVRDVELRPRRDGGEYLKVLLGDRSGSVPAVIWDEVQSARELCIPGQVVHATGRYCVHSRYGPQLAIQAVRAAGEDEFAAEDLLDGPPRGADQMEADLRELLSTVQSPFRAMLPSKKRARYSWVLVLQTKPQTDFYLFKLIPQLSENQELTSKN